MKKDVIKTKMVDNTPGLAGCSSATGRAGWGEGTPGLSVIAPLFPPLSNCSPSCSSSLLVSSSLRGCSWLDEVCEEGCGEREEDDLSVCWTLFMF